MGQPVVAGDEKTGSSDADGDGLSTLKAAKNSGTWWFPLLEAVAHRVLVEIRERLEWAAVYLAKMPVEPSSENRYRTGP